MFEFLFSFRKYLCDFNVKELASEVDWTSICSSLRIVSLFRVFVFSRCLFEFDVVEYSNLTGHLFVCGRHSIIDSAQTYQTSK